MVAYRVRTPSARGGSVVVARSPDGEHLTPVATLHRDRFGAESLERPALVRLPDGGWRLYVSCATPGTKHWRIDALEAPEPEGFAGAEPRVVLPGDAGLAVKDPVVRRRGDGGRRGSAATPWTSPGLRTGWSRGTPPARTD